MPDPSVISSGLDWVGLVTAAGVLVLAIGTAWAGVITARNSKKLDVVAAEAVAISAEAKVITGHVNSAASLAKQREENLLKQLADVNSLLAKQEQKAALLAQNAATTAATTAKRAR